MVCFCLVSAFISLMLPETVGTTQPETPSDLQKLFDNHRIFTCLSKGKRRPAKKSQQLQQVRLTGITRLGTDDETSATSKTNLVY